VETPFKPYALVLNKGADPRTGGIAICGFSSSGMVGVIAASHVISALGLEQQGTALNAEFPAVALIQDEVPKHPVRVYQGEGIGVFTAEIQFEDDKDIALATTVLEWFSKGGFDRLIIVDGLLRPDKDFEGGDLYGVGSTDAMREALRTAGIEPIRQGVVSGITGFLLGEGDRLGMDIVALLAEAHPMYPDARAAAIAVEAISDLTGLDLPLSDLLENARTIEDSVREMIERAKSVLPDPIGPGHQLGSGDGLGMDPSVM